MSIFEHIASMNSEPNMQPAVIIIGAGSTALAIVRCFAKVGVRPTVINCGGNDIATYSRQCETLMSPVSLDDHDEFLSWLLGLQKSGERYFLIPESDAARLLLAKMRQQLPENYLCWESAYADIENLVKKDKLYRHAEQSGIPVPKSFCGGTVSDLSKWLATVKGPYFAKPFYAGDKQSPILEKNQLFHTAEEVMAFAATAGCTSIIVQQQLFGGDGNVYDCYGLCDKAGRITVSATHRRLRQSNPGRGVTSFGEIPASSSPFSPRDLVELTEKLFRVLPYHGIFGVEWLWDKDSERLYLIDVNARPFSTIGHLCDSGINLPALALEEIQGRAVIQVSSTGHPRHTYWVNFSTDIFSARKHIKAGNLTLTQWVRDLFSCSSYAYWRMNDPMPMLIKAKRVTLHLVFSVLKRI